VNEVESEKSIVLLSTTPAPYDVYAFRKPTGWSQMHESDRPSTADWGEHADLPMESTGNVHRPDTRELTNALVNIDKVKMPKTT
jgi:hypothetical protein